MDSLVTDAFFLFLKVRLMRMRMMIVMMMMFFKERELATEMEESQDMTMFLNLSVVVERSYLARAQGRRRSRQARVEGVRPEHPSWQFKCKYFFKKYLFLKIFQKRL